MKSKPTPADRALEIAAVLMREQQPPLSVEEAEALRELVRGHFGTPPSDTALLRLANWLLAGLKAKGLFGKKSDVPPQLACTMTAFVERVGRLEPAQVSALYLAACCSLRSERRRSGKAAVPALLPELKRWFKIGVPPGARPELA